MRSPTSHFDKRCIALVMLLVWMFTIGVGFVSACVPDEARSVSAPMDHHGGLASMMVRPLTMTTNGNSQHVRGGHGDDDVRLHQVHCQPDQAPARAQAARQSAEKSPDLDAIVATITHWTRPLHTTDRRSSVRLRLDPVVSDLPLFIRFRRLTP